jgi:hypothetical protein
VSVFVVRLCGSTVVIVAFLPKKKKKKYLHMVSDRGSTLRLGITINFVDVLFDYNVANKVDLYSCR